MIKSSLIVLHICLFSFSASSIFRFYNRLACLACRFCPFGVRVSSWRLSNPLGSSCWHERQDAGWSLQDWLALQVNDNKKPSGWSVCVCQQSSCWVRKFSPEPALQTKVRPPDQFFLVNLFAVKRGRLKASCVSSRRELPFTKTAHLSNPWNEHKPVKIGRDGQVSSCFHFSCFF